MDKSTTLTNNCCAGGDGSCYEQDQRSQVIRQNGKHPSSSDALSYKPPLCQFCFCLTRLQLPYSKKKDAHEKEERQMS